MSSPATARAAMLSTTRPSFTAALGTCTPSQVASTSRCGVMSLSPIHSYSARNRYGRFEVIAGASLTVSFPRKARSRRQLLPQHLLFRRQAAQETGIAEDALAVVLDQL